MSVIQLFISGAAQWLQVEDCVILKHLSSQNLTSGLILWFNLQVYVIVIICLGSFFSKYG